MKSIHHSLLLISLFLATACSPREAGIPVVLSDEVINPAYVGNGVQWDPYDEAERWGAPVSDADWQKLYTRLDFMQPRFVRCLINSPYRYYDRKTKSYDKERNEESISKLLSYCQENNITVLFGEYNPPDWSMKQDTAWINMAVDYLNFLVNEKGFSCIRYYNLFNEPDGNWSSTNGNYEMWKEMVFQFTERMKLYPGLTEKVSMAGPDVVIGYKNAESPYQPWEWIRETGKDMDSLFGIYDIHAYPGQYEVRSGAFAAALAQYVDEVPEGKKIVLGEAGYKYYKPEDQHLAEEYRKRAELHPLTKGSDCNMLVYDFFYGLDMPLLCMEVMNNGLSGMAVWMLDDAMHSSGDSGDTTNIKLWGMWNILGEEAFGMPEEENIRPWYYTWSLMCRYFPEGTDIVRFSGDIGPGIRTVAGRKDGKTVLAMVNTTDQDASLQLVMPRMLKDVKTYLYSEGKRPADEGIPVPVRENEQIRSGSTLSLPANSFMLLTDNSY